MTVFYIALGVVVLLAIAFVGVSFVRRDRDKAIGYLSKESLKRDAEGRKREAAENPDLAAGPKGRDIERAAVLDRKGGALVPAAAAPTSSTVALKPPLDNEQMGVTRRQFLNRSIIGLFVFSLAAFGAQVIAFLWPTLKGGFGSKIRMSKTVNDYLADIASTREPIYNAEGRFYLVPYPAAALDKAKAEPSYAAVLPGYEAGLAAIYQKCVHLGCRVPWCASSQWFECPCHGSQYNRVGERKAGPAPRGLDRFAVAVEGGVPVVDTAKVIAGPPLGTDTTGQQIEGPHCA